MRRRGEEVWRGKEERGEERRGERRVEKGRGEERGGEMIVRLEEKREEDEGRV